MKSKITWCFALGLLFLTQLTFAQQKTITGTVTDGKNLPLPGVNIVVQGTSVGTQTDFDGNYSISAQQGQTLVFTYVGFEEQQKAIGVASTVNVEMTAGEALDEVVVVAYGTQTKKSLVGSVTSLSAENLEKQQLTTVTGAIQGTVAGVNVITSGGQPGNNPTIRIRGIGSINASADPLIVVDGVPFNGNINTISADQIESMNVLKDASSTALYGSRAANGVILITTKKGSYNSAPKITLTAVTGFSSPAVDLHEVIGNNDFMRYSWEAQRNANQYVSGQTAALAGQNASNELIPLLGYNPYNVAQPIDANGNLVPGANSLWQTNWQDAILRDTSLRNEYTLGISGGGDRSRYFLSANYLDQQGSVRTSDFKRITTRLNLESKVTDWLTVGLNTSLSNSTQNVPIQSGSTFGSSIQWIYSTSSIYPLYRRAEDGSLIRDNFGNPIYDYGSNTGQDVNGTRPLLGNENAAGALYNNETRNKRTNVIANGFAQVDFTDYLSFKTNISYENYLNDGFGYDNYAVGAAASVGGRVDQDRDITTTLNINNALNFNKRFGDHQVGATALFETYQYKFDALGAQGTGYLPGVKVLNGATTPEGITGYVNEERITSYLGRLSYSFKDRYFLEGSFRRDGSTRFSTDTRWGNFYSIGGSWVVSDENFLANSDVLSLFKLRASYGELGNNQGIGYFPYLQLFDTGWNELDNTGVLLGGVTDPRLTWETTAILDLGVDFGFFKNRIEGTVAYFTKEAIDLLYDRPLPISTGNSSITTNTGSIKNSGVEVNVTGHIIRTANVQWSAGVNFAFVKNEITELTQDGFINGTKRYEVGKSIYDFYIQEWAGVDPEDGYGMWYMDEMDADGNPTGEKVTTKNYSEAGRYYQDSALPDVTGGFNTDLRVGNFDFSALFNFAFGGTFYDSSYASLMDGFSRPGYQASPNISARWQQPGDVTDVPLLLNANNDFNGTSTRFLYDNDFVRLRALTLGYTLPSSVAESIYVDKLRFYLRGDNLFTWQSHTGIDPEQNLAGTTDSRSSILKTVSLGVNLNF
ncbi:SusC/RagA family TonB-linked outer membrane protein [Leeuwenhoekiella marinoflava]|uniref:TonB-linked SusC/RagA family outer membrane protein n=2 Tax=Leeuwenhoekiella marinoflava TaxID=988 RepID=A0A4Q0PJ10_9FLAO|nr:TonB-dependent receptor [Leeuwenhoekiella marinoflava]RXG27348.1 TonB-linked SusC/RagA family outer membrane protein [Leeuwenhoekiella marinoflava]SHF71841.1 TonB-linked outer membrane protein, SusC/RagA family [Leeuwenhoekiella marinoflava DSM 3653]